MASTDQTPRIRFPDALGSPPTVDRTLRASLAQSCGLRLDGPPTATALTPMRLWASPNLSLARQLVADCLRPASDSPIHQALGVVAELTTQRRQGEGNADLVVAAYRQRLRQYPADIALGVLAGWPDVSPWWPTWAELRVELEAAFAWRRMVLPALQRAEAAMLAAPEPEPEPSPEDIAAVKAMRDATVAALRAVGDPGRRLDRLPPRVDGRRVSLAEAVKARAAARHG